MSKFKIGAQMYTLRDTCGTVEGVARSCERVKQMGYDGIQCSAALLSTLDPAILKQIKKAADDNGLEVAATHESLDNIRNQFDAVVEKHRILDCKLTAIGGFFPKMENWSLKMWQDFIADYNTHAKRLATKGIRLGYHNHSHEFAWVEGPGGAGPAEAGHAGRVTPMAMLAEGLDASVWFEVDVYWVAHGLADPAAWLKKLAASGKDRLPALHYKDGTVTVDRQHKMCEVGAGNLNWPAILEATKAAGTQWLLVERDSGDLDPFESLEISIKNMREWGI
ncbi:MAG: sugar phosphate isomerase/epimerase family protein [Phycisphaerales bacterium]